MYWPEEFANSIIKSGKHKPYWVDDMKTPSGRVHIGSVRAVVTHELVYRALKDKKVNATFSYVLEDHDPFDKLPGYLDKQKFEKHLAKPLFQIPSPEPGYKNYGHRWGQEYIDIFNSVGTHPKVIWGSQLYLSGKMNPEIKICLDNADKIRHIYKTLYGHNKPKTWYPFNAVCEKCGKMSTTDVSSWDGKKVAYECKVGALDWSQGCGHKAQTSPFSSKNRFAGKLPWKVEWPCKWKVIGVTIEGAGKDHLSEGGSHDFGKLMCKQVINYPIPFHFSHEFFLVGGRKMSSSKGTGSSAKEISEIIPAFIIRFMIARVKYNRAINFDPSGMTIPDLFDAYDEAALAYWNKSDKKLARIFELSQVKDQPPKKHFLPRFRDIATFIQYPEIDVDKKFAEIKGSKLTAQENDVLKTRIKYAQIWLEGYAPKEYIFAPTKDVPDEARNLNAKQKTYLKSIAKLLDKKWQKPEGLQQALYDKSKELELSSKQAFSSIYLSLINKNHGPKAAWFLLKHKALAKDRFVNIDKLKAKTIEKLKLEVKKSNLISIDPSFAKKYPSATVGFALIEGVTVKKLDPALETERKDFLKDQRGLTTEQISELPEIQSYRQMYKDMGLSWHSRRPSPEALLRRIARGKGLHAPINTAVDAYNLIVMKNRVSVGAFDADAIKFPCQLRIAQGGETAHFIGDDKDETLLKKGEVCYFDQIGPYNMDYNYRDATRSLSTPKTKNFWINTEGIYDISPKQVQQTLEDTIKILTKYCGGKVKTKGILLAANVR